jgi:hypothetical protein
VKEKLAKGRAEAHKRRQQLEADLAEIQRMRAEKGRASEPVPSLDQVEKAKRVTPDNQAERRKQYRERQLLAAYKSTRSSKAPVVTEVLEEVCRMLGKKKLAQFIVDGLESENPVEKRNYAKIILDYVRVHTKETNAAKDEDIDDITEQQIDAIVAVEYGIKPKRYGDEQKNLDEAIPGLSPDSGGCATTEEAAGAEGADANVAAEAVRADSNAENVSYVERPGTTGFGSEPRSENDDLCDGSGLGGDGNAPVH